MHGRRPDHIETGNNWLDRRAAKECDLAPGQYLSVCVTDSGAGMTPEVIERAVAPSTPQNSWARAKDSAFDDPRLRAPIRPRFTGEAEVDVAFAQDRSLDPGQGKTVLLIIDEEPIRMLSARPGRGWLPHA